MTRKALLIANPGEIGAENYCEGVNKDMDNYKTFLTSPLGGLWYTNEVDILHKPNKATVREAIQKLKGYDYSKIIFSGHGVYSSIHKSTILELNKSESIDSVELRNGSKKQTVILDCCRKVEKIIIHEFVERLMKAAAITQLSPSECRRYYDSRIEECDIGLIVMYACSINETAGDDSSKGGYYSHSLISSATKWADSDSKDISKTIYYFSAIMAHDAASSNVQSLSGGRQKPVIEKPRSGPYFPFAIMA